MPSCFFFGFNLSERSTLHFHYPLPFGLLFGANQTEINEAIHEELELGWAIGDFSI